VKLGYSNFIPPGPELEAKRDLIRKEIQKLVDVFGIEYGMIHPEFFITENDELGFGEVACRIPGGHILELVSKAYDFDAIGAFILCHDPDASEEELDALFPASEQDNVTIAGCVMVYPKPGRITALEIPDELQEDPFFEEHTLFPPSEHKVSDDREGYGNHYGTLFFKGDDPKRMKDLLAHYENVDFYK
jgi:biotin carboxylase